MERYNIALDLKSKGYKIKEIAKEMKIKPGSVSSMLTYARHPEVRKKMNSASHQNYKTRKKVRIMSIINNELKLHFLPMEWNEKIYNMIVKSFKTGRKYKDEIDALLVLLCRRERIPSPASLNQIVSQGHTGKTGGYMNALQLFNGVSASKPVDYIRFFLKEMNLEDMGFEEKALVIQNKISLSSLQSANPRVLAAAILYVILHDKPTKRYGSYFNQSFISKKLQVTDVALRRTLKRLNLRK